METQWQASHALQARQPFTVSCAGSENSLEARGITKNHARLA